MQLRIKTSLLCHGHTFWRLGNWLQTDRNSEVVMVGANIAEEWRHLTVSSLSVIFSKLCIATVFHWWKWFERQTNCIVTPAGVELGCDNIYKLIKLWSTLKQMKTMSFDKYSIWRILSFLFTFSYTFLTWAYQHNNVQYSFNHKCYGSTC